MRSPHLARSPSSGTARHATVPHRHQPSQANENPASKGFLRQALWLFCFSILVVSPISGQVVEGIEVRLAEVSVRVVSKGEPIRGLTAERFRLLIDGRSVPIQSVEEVDREDTSVTADPEGQDKLLLLFDYGLTETALIERAREQARELVLSPLAGMPVAVATYRQSNGIEILLPFSADRRQILKAIEPHQTINAASARDPLGLVLTTETESQSTAQRSGAVNRRVRGTDTITRPALVADRALHFLEAFSTLAERLNSVPGHKTVVLFSRGLDDEILVGDAPSGPDFRAFQRSRVARADDQFTHGDSRVRDSMAELIRRLSTAGTTVYTVDLGTMDGATPSGQESLRKLAMDTGGEPLAYLRLGEVIQTLVDKTAHRYIVSFDPAGLPPKKGASNPGHRGLEVRIVDLPRRANIFSASHFVANARSGDALVDAHRLLFGESGGAIRVRSRVLPSIQGTGERSLLPFVLEIPGPDLLAENADPIIELQVIGYAIDSDHRINDHIAQNLQLDRSTVGDRLQNGGLLFLGVFEVTDEVHTLRLLVKSGEDGSASVAVAEAREPGRDGDLQVFIPSDSNWLPAASPRARKNASAFLPAGRRATRAMLETRPGATVELQLASPSPLPPSQAWKLALVNQHRTLVVAAPRVTEEGTLTFDMPMETTPGSYSLILSSGGEPTTRPTTIEVLIRP